jgi:MFS family permease
MCRIFKLNLKSNFTAPFIAGPLADKIGRKWTLLSSTVFFVLSWVLLATTASVPQIYVARLLQGMGVGFVMTVQTMYIGEISTDESRGALGSLMQLFIVTGILFSYAVGPYTSYVLFQWLCCIIPLVFAGCFFLMPESPYYYIAKGQQKEAIASLKFLRGKSEAGVQDELVLIQNAIEEAQKNKGSVADIFKNKGNLKALTISAGLISFQQLSGINVILFYSQSIFIKTGSSLDPALATILVGVVQVIASGCTPFIADRLGRKLILLISAAGMCLFLVSYTHPLKILFILTPLILSCTVHDGSVFLSRFNSIQCFVKFDVAACRISDWIRHRLLHWFRSPAMGCTG